jgi:hypothetical protein
MCKIFYSTLLFFLLTDIFAQKRFRDVFPTTVFTTQFAGSTGFLTIGFSKATVKKRLEIGLFYGVVPRSLGGVNRSVSLKFLYNPFYLKLHKKITFEPIQTGIFLCQNFGDNLSTSWGNKYPKGYYWWTRSLRFHYFLSSQIAYKLENKRVDRIAYYFETNTNDLYVASYISNTKTIGLYDIFYFGMGLRLYLK